MKTLSVWLGGWVLGWGLWLAVPVQAESWQKLSVSPCGEAPALSPDYNPGTYFNDVAVPSANTVYIAGGEFGPGIICKSTDRGETWAQLDIPIEHPIYGIDCLNDLICYAVTYGADPLTCVILKTTNGNDFSPTSIDDCYSLWDIQIVPGTGGNVVVAVGDSRVDPVGSSTDRHAPKIVRTSNGGATWTSIPLPAFPLRWGGNPLYSVHFANNSVGWAVGTSTAFFKSNNGGASWETTETPRGPNCSGHWKSVQVFDPAKIWATGCGYSVRSDDGGATWTDPVLITHQASATAPSDSHFVNASTGWAVSGLFSTAFSGLIRKSVNGGDSFPALNYHNPENLSEEERAIWEDIQIYDGAERLTEIPNLKAIEFYRTNLGFIVGDGQTVLRRFVDRPDLVPQEGWSMACAGGSRSLHIAAGIRNEGVRDVTAEMLPFTVRLEALTGTGGEVVDGAVQDFNVTVPIAVEGFYSVDNFGIGISPSDLYAVFAPAIAADGMLTVRMCVDVNDSVPEGPEGEANNCREQTTSCGVGAPAEVGPPGGGFEPPSPFPPARGERKFEKEKQKKPLIKKVLKKKVDKKKLKPKQKVLKEK